MHQAGAPAWFFSGTACAGQCVGVWRAYGADVLGVRRSRRGCTSRNELATSRTPESTAGFSSSLKRRWMRNARSGALHDTVPGIGHFGWGATVLPPSHPIREDASCTSRPEVAPHWKWPRTRSRTCRPHTRRPCPPDALAPAPPSQALGDNRAGRDGQRHIVLLEVQHRLHLAADEPVVHPRVRRAVQGTPPPPASPPANTGPPLPLPAIAGRGHRTSAQGCCASSCLWPGRSQRTRRSAWIYRRPSAPPIS